MATTTEAKKSFSLTYFPLRGRGEAVRLVFEDTKTPYENVIATHPDFGTNIKPKLLFGQLPLLKDGDFELVQSNAILRHLGRRLGNDLYGRSIQDNARVDCFLDGAEDIRGRYLRLIYGEGCTDAAKAAYLADFLPGALANFEKGLAATKVAGYLIGDYFTIADASFFEVLDTQVALSPTALDATPLLKAYHARVAARPNLAAYFASGRRPTAINGNGKGQPAPKA